MRLAGALLALALAACAAPAATPPAPEAAALGEQRSEAGAVTVVAAWLDGPVPSLRVALDTHSVDLDGFDLAASARLRIDGGAWVAPSAWDAPTGGHHRSGTLTFAALAVGAVGAARTIELEIRDVAAESRLLRWQR
ncbi:MAG TPA: hypothetical protein VFM93_06595 [Candidatus Limnocylindria bacterium]|nr:hypothetical protein [Candidatus Limnocylindria bacterium]